jgi:prevent-host-death family protein
MRSVGVGELSDHASVVIDAVAAGERITLTVHGAPVADIVPHARRSRWLAGVDLQAQLSERRADPGLRAALDALSGQPLDER